MLTAKSYTRITLGLDIIKKITQGPYQGFHELNIVKHQIDLFDTIKIMESGQSKIICNHPDVPLDQRNIVFKVVHLLKTVYQLQKNVTIEIEKNIPVKGGLAGGSANAATVFLLLDQLWDLKMTHNQLIQLSRKIGMDVPYYFVGGTARDSEAAEQLAKIQSNVKPLTFLLTIPDFGISTKEAYQSLDYSKIGKNTHQTSLIQQGFESDQPDLIIKNMHNDFEQPVMHCYPQLKLIKEQMLQAGCLNAVLSGSGSTIAGVVKNKKDAVHIQKKLGDQSIIAQSLSFYT